MDYTILVWAPLLLSFVEEIFVSRVTGEKVVTFSAVPLGDGWVAITMFSAFGPPHKREMQRGLPVPIEGYLGDSCPIRQTSRSWKRYLGTVNPNGRREREWRYLHVPASIQEALILDKWEESLTPRWEYKPCFSGRPDQSKNRAKWRRSGKEARHLQGRS